MALPALALATKLAPFALDIGKGVVGGFQRRKAKKMEESLERPDPVSERQRQVESALGQIARGGVPGEQAAREDIARATANRMAAIRQSGNIGQIMAGAQAAQQTETQAQRALATDVASQKRGAMESFLRYKSQLGLQALAQAREDFKAKAASISAMKQAGAKNIATGAAGVVGAGMTALDHFNKQNNKTPAPLDGGFIQAAASRGPAQMPTSALIRSIQMPQRSTTSLGLSPDYVEPQPFG